MRKRCTDSMGTYEVNIQNKPQELTHVDETAIYLNLFDNGNIENACRYKLSLGVSSPSSSTENKDWYCPILNHMEAARWLRQVPEQHRDNPFYRQTQYKIAEIKKSGMKFVKSPSAGFFKAPRSKGMENSKRPNLPNATAMLFIEEDQNPYVYMRFMDMWWDGYLEPTGRKGRSPKFAACLKSSHKEEEYVELDYSEYF